MDYYVGFFGEQRPLTRDRWLQFVLEERFQVQPPTWWLKSHAWRSIEVANWIWHRNYKPTRKYVIWDQAPEEDFRARGYLR